MSRPPARRPTLLPTLRRLWRDTHRLQLGTDPGRAVLLELTDPGCARVLDLLDGSRTEPGLLRAAERVGVNRDHAATLVQALRSIGLVVDAHLINPPELRHAAAPTRSRLSAEAAALAVGPPVDHSTADGLNEPRPGDERFRPRAGISPAARLRRRLAAHVIVTGTSQLAVPIAAALASAGVGHLDPNVTGTTDLADAAPVGLLPSDARRPRRMAAADALRRVAPDVRVAQLRPEHATFAVLVGFNAPAELTAFSYGQRRLAHLAVGVRDGTVIVGPLVRPGVTPCLNCLDLHRLDRDPAWRVVAAQLADGPDHAEPIATTTVLAATAYAAAEVLAHIDGGTPSTVGATVEISRPGSTRRRRWTQHPECGCRRRRRRR